MRLDELLAAAGLDGGGPVEVSGLAYDSRRVRPGDLFVAIAGEHVDGHRYASQAVEQGAVAVVHESRLADLGVAMIQVVRSRLALARLAAAFHSHPSREMLVVGVTGTDGKTTTCALAAAAMTAAGFRPGVLTTVFWQLGAERLPNPTRQTTLESLDLQEALAQMLAAGCDSAVIEVSSHALVLDRVEGVEFDIAAVTNVSSEHLDFHGSDAAYLEAKATLVDRSARSVEKGMAKTAVLNAGDRSFPVMAARPIERRLAYLVERDLTAAHRGPADLVASGVRTTPAGSSFTVGIGEHRVAVELGLPGSFNVENATCAIGIAAALGGRLEQAAAGVAACLPVPGRMQPIDLGQPFRVVVDYAHTALALRRALDDLVPPAPARLMVMFGSAGERDRRKREEMGRIAADRCALVVLTEEDDRDEDGSAILAEIASGAESAGAVRGQTLLLVHDREEAIRQVLGRAAPGDVVLLAGKGHESSILGPSGPRPWNEVDHAIGALVELGYAPPAGWGASPSGRLRGTPVRRG
ncbi:MAG: UDP-N-acetylmuramoyl-L-alanyl-D-glutamate--2,6-diaminopimelate ligase [Candidatus Dormibacteria bacterium]